MKKESIFIVSILIVLSLSISAASSVQDTQDKVVLAENAAVKINPADEAVKESAQWANNKKAMPIASDDGRVLFIYGQSAPTIICAPLRVCDLELETGEVVQDVNVGDKIRWILTPSISGSGDSRTVHVIIKPTDFNLDTNAIITTDRRTYHLRLISHEGEYVTRIGFSYPDSQKRDWEAQKLAMQKKDELVTADLPSLSVTSLNFEYSVQTESGRAAFKPLRVFDDGSKVYVQMPREMRTDEAPAFLVLGTDGKEQLVNYRVKHDYYIVDKLFNRAVMLAGVASDQDKVVITRCNKRGLFGRCEI